MGRGSSKVGGNNSAAPTITADTDYRDAYWVRDYERGHMDAALNEVTTWVRGALANDPDIPDDYFYDLMGSEYGRRVRGDDPELVWGIDYDNERITSVDVYYRNYGNGDVRIDLRPHSYHFDSFSPEELEDMGVDEWDWNEARQRRRS